MAAIVCLTVPISFCAGDDTTVDVPGSVTVTIPQPVVGKFVPDEAPKPTGTHVSVEEPAGVTPVTPEQPSENKGETTVTPVTVAAESVDVSLTGPPSVGSGDFVIVAFADATEGAELTFTYDPDPGPTHRTVFQEFGGKRKLVVFVQPPAGAYRIVLLGQITTSAKDPTDVAVHDVTVGTPTPPEPKPIPGPDLKGFAKQVYDASAGLDKATATKAAGAYGSQVSAINAGAYNALSIDAAKEAIAGAIAEANPPRETAKALFDLIDGELQRREEAGQFATLPSISAALAEITAGLEARAR